MLVLTRKPLEEIVIAGNIRIRVLGVQGNRIKLGIDAPPEIDIQRGELVEDEGSSPSPRPLAAHGRAERAGFSDGPSRSPRAAGAR